MQRTALRAAADAECSAPAGLVIEHQEASTVILYLIPAMPERELSLRVEFALDKLGFAVIRQEACFAVLR